MGRVYVITFIILSIAVIWEWIRKPKFDTADPPNDRIENPDSPNYTYRTKAGKIKSWAQIRCAGDNAMHEIDTQGE